MQILKSLRLFIYFIYFYLFFSTGKRHQNTNNTLNGICWAAGSTKSTKEHYHRKVQCSQLSRTQQIKNTNNQLKMLALTSVFCKQVQDSNIWFLSQCSLKWIEFRYKVTLPRLCCNLFRDNVNFCQDSQGLSQRHSAGWTRFHFHHFFPEISIFVSYFSPGGRVACCMK